ncbi:MAG: hypothetical protein NTV34_15045, partial [Proteobacteria bacterium]|nr:hypothetical protein [Pseudomonadota bacterium]
MKRILALSFFYTSLSLNGCSEGVGGNSPSSLSDIANPGGPNEGNTLFWVEQEIALKGLCAKGLPTTRVNCNQQVQRSALTEIASKSTATAKAELDRATSSVAIEVKKLKDSDPTVAALNAEIQTLTSQKNALEKSVAVAKTQIEERNVLKKSKEVMVAYDDEQLAAIAKLLETTPQDQKLLTLQVFRRAEKAQLISEISTLSEQILKLTTRLTYDQNTLVSVVADLTSTQAQLKKVFDELQVSSDALDSFMAAQGIAKAAFDGIPEVVLMIKTGSVAYRGNLLSPGLQQSLRILAMSFTPASALNPGRYERESGPTNYCPQKAEPTMAAGLLKSVKITYLSPCGGQTGVYTCTGLDCIGPSNSRMKILDITHYKFNNGSGDAVMKFVSPSLDGTGTEGGPE